MLALRDEADESEQWYKKGSSWADSEELCLFADDLWKRGYPADAERWYRQALDSGDADAQAAARAALAQLGKDVPGQE